MFVLLLTLFACTALTCSDYPVGVCSDAQVCCSSVECLYTASGEEFICDGTDCASAGEDFTQFCSRSDTGG